MTLCVVSRHKDQVQVATDSRLTFEDTSADIGVKVMALPLRLYPAATKGARAPVEPTYARTLGLAAVGSLTTTYVTKQLLETVLSSLQFAPGNTDISMAGIAEVCARVLRGVSREVCKVLADRGEGIIVLVGRCLVSDQARVFTLGVNAAQHPLEVDITEFHEEDQPLFLGSGAEAAREQPAHSVFAFDIVRKIVRARAVRTVGGNVQFGVLKPVAEAAGRSPGPPRPPPAKGRGPGPGPGLGLTDNG